MPYTSGDVITWAWLTFDRRPSSIPVPISYIQNWDAPNGDAEGPQTTIDFIKQKIAKDEIIEAGPIPFMPYWWPSSKEGSVVPDSLSGGQLPVTKDLLLAQPHTFIRKTQFITDIHCSFYQALMGAYNTINDVNDARSDVNGLKQYNFESYGWQQLSYDNEGMENGSQYSHWMFWIDGTIMSALIPHTKLEVNGSESFSLERYWRPQDIWNNIILPKINQNHPIRRLGEFDPEEDDEEEIPNTLAVIGELNNTQYIQAASYLGPWPGYNLPIEELGSYTAPITPVGGSNNPTQGRGDFFELHPGFNIPNVAKSYRFAQVQALQNLYNHMKETSGLSNNTTNMLLFLNGAGMPYQNPNIMATYLERFLAGTDYNSNLDTEGDYRVRNIAGVGEHRFTIQIPSDVINLVDLWVVGVPAATFVDQSFTYNSSFGTSKENDQGPQDYDQFNGTVTKNMSGTINKLVRFPIKEILTDGGDTAQPGDMVGIRVDHNSIGTNIDYLGLIIGYTR